MIRWNSPRFRKPGTSLYKTSSYHYKISSTSLGLEIKSFLPNWQQITKNSEIIETVQEAKTPYSTILSSTVKNNQIFTQPKTDAFDNEISKLL